MEIIEANPDPHHEFGELAIGDVFRTQGFGKLYIKTNEIFSQSQKLRPMLKKALFFIMLMEK